MSRRNPWFAVAHDAMTLAAESWSVMSLRMMKASFGGSAAQDEARLMVEEKLQAGFELQGRAMTGALGLTPVGIASETICFYRAKVRANQRRLTRS